jgi:putative transposase
VLGVRYQNTVFGSLLKAVPRRRFAAIVERHGGDKYVKGFSSWDHLVTLVFGQLGGLSSLREVETVWNAQAVHHYHLGSGPIRRSTLSDANWRRPSAVFAEVFAELSAMAAGALAREGQQVLRLIDATPIPLSSVHKWAEWNGRTRGLKTHVIYDPEADRPVHLEITAARSTMWWPGAVSRSSQEPLTCSTKPMPIMPGGSVCTRLAVVLSPDPKAMCGCAS